jgi:hypothetical protein
MVDSGELIPPTPNFGATGVDRRSLRTATTRGWRLGARILGLGRGQGLERQGPSGFVRLCQTKKGAGVRVRAALATKPCQRRLAGGVCGLYEWLWLQAKAVPQSKTLVGSPDGWRYGCQKDGQATKCLPRRSVPDGPPAEAAFAAPWRDRARQTPPLWTLPKGAEKKTAINSQ